MSPAPPAAARLARLARLAAAPLAATGLLMLACAPGAEAVAPLVFEHRLIDAHNALSGVSCVSEARCLAVDGTGQVLASSDAATGAWETPVQIDSERALTSVSCVPEGFCLAGDAAGGLLHSLDGGQTWSRVQTGESAILSVSCASSSLCAAVASSGEVLASEDPEAGGSWVAAGVEHVGLSSVSCAGSLCVAAGAGDVASSSDPAHAHSWGVPRAVDPALDLSAISCGPGEACVATDESGQLLASADAARASATWSSTPADALGALDGLSCASSGLCLAVGAHGEAIAGDDAVSATPAWSEYHPEAAGDMTAVACLQEGLCVAVDTAGIALTARAGAPAATTLSPSALGESSATLQGQLNAHDAALDSCVFEYGTSAAYGASAPCASVPGAGAGEQPVDAALAGLSPNTTYHYRLAAASARGASDGADLSFTTAVSSAVAIVHPHPSITGTPAVGATLTCQSGIAAGTGARTAYQWLRNQLALPGATNASYTVRGADNGAHLQCQLTATDGGGSASATSGFVNVPYQSPPAASGETAVGRAAQAGARVFAPVTCAVDASSGCRIVLRAFAREGGRTVALAAGSTRVAAGHLADLAVALTASARRLLAARRRIAATLTVSGTVIGVIEARLSSQSIELTETAARAKKAARAILEASPLPGRRRAAIAAAHPSAAAARPARTLSPTPYMGWDTYFAFGGSYDEATVLEQASRLISLGLAHEGYRYVWLDVGWWQGARAAGGAIEVNARQWPHGMRWLASTLHAAGLKLGLYTDAGANGCGGTREGSYGHYQQDVDTFAAWGFDAVKVDFCGGAELHLSPAAAYTSFHQAILAAHRPMLLDVCDFLQPGQYSEGRPAIGESAFTSYLFGQSIANSWRTDTDVGAPGDVSFSSVLRNIDADASAPQAAGPGHWNDPDYLGPDQGLSAAQFRTQLSMWSILAAPLMISDDLQKISPASLQAVRRSAVIAIDQDPAGRQGTLLSSSGQGQVWVKPLAGGERAVALLNRGSSPLVISTSASALALPAGPPYRVRNLWDGAVSASAGAIAASVPAQSTVLLRVGLG